MSLFLLDCLNSRRHLLSMDSIKLTNHRATAWRQWYEHVHACTSCHDVIQNVTESFALRRPDLYCFRGADLLRSVYVERGTARQSRLAA
jgi:hypothetical protein